MSQSHEKDTGSLLRMNMLQHISGFVLRMPGIYMKTAAHPAMCHRNPEQFRHSHRRGDSRHDLIIQPGILKCLRLLAAPAKHKGISALEPYHCLIMSRRLDQDLLDLFLLPVMHSRLLSDIDLLCMLRHQFQQFVGSEPVIDHRITPAQKITPKSRDQSRMPGPRSDQIDHTRSSLTTLPSCTSIIRILQCPSTGSQHTPNAS